MKQELSCGGAGGLGNQKKGRDRQGRKRRTRPAWQTAPVWQRVSARVVETKNRGRVDRRRDDGREIGSNSTHKRATTDARQKEVDGKERGRKRRRGEGDENNDGGDDEELARRGDKQARQKQSRAEQSRAGQGRAEQQAKR